MRLLWVRYRRFQCPPPHSGRKFENSVFTLKTHIFSSLFTTPKKFGGKKTHRSFWICVRSKLGLENHTSYRDVIVFDVIVLAPFLKCFPSTVKRNAGVFKFFRFQEQFKKAPFSWRISVEGRPEIRNKAVFSIFSCEVWTMTTLLKSVIREHWLSKGRFIRYDFVACDKLTTILRHELFRVNPTTTCSWRLLCTSKKCRRILKHVCPL